jgi:hypothetical protein
MHRLKRPRGATLRGGTQVRGTQVRGTQVRGTQVRGTQVRGRGVAVGELAAPRVEPPPGRCRLTSPQGGTTGSSTPDAPVRGPHPRLARWRSAVRTCGARPCAAAGGTATRVQAHVPARGGPAPRSHSQGAARWCRRGSRPRCWRFGASPTARAGRWVSRTGASGVLDGTIRARGFVSLQRPGGALTVPRCVDHGARIRTPRAPAPSRRACYASARMCAAAPSARRDGM